MKSPRQPSPVSKKERGPERAAYYVERAYHGSGWVVRGHNDFCQYFFKLGEANICAMALNTAYLAGKRSRSKGRGK